jgi:hypothetical protein
VIVNARWWRTLLIACGLVAAGLAVAGPDVLFDALLQRSRTSGTDIVPDRFLRSWDPLTVFFAGPKGSGPGPEDRPERFVALDPPMTARGPGSTRGHYGSNVGHGALCR